MTSISFLKCIVVFSTVVSVSPCQSQSKAETRSDFKKYFEPYNVLGSFVLYDMRNDKYLYSDEQQCATPFIPASTFKICNSLIGLETGVIKDENFVIKWDSVQRHRPEWNKDHDLKTAFKNSTVWYYQELARRVGGGRMKYWLDKAGYGNRDTSGGIDMFWLSGGLRISPMEQIGFLRRLYSNTLPFSQRTMEIVKKIMIVKDTSTYTLRAKTGWADGKKEYIGWYVGYIEKKGDPYFFACCIQCADPDNPDFGKARIEIALRILKEMRLL